MPKVQVQTKRILPSIHHIKCDVLKKTSKSSSMNLLFLFHPVKPGSKPQNPTERNLWWKKYFALNWPRKIHLYQGQGLCDWDFSAPLSPLILVQFLKCWLVETRRDGSVGSGNSFCFPAPLSDGVSSYPLTESVELNQSYWAVLLSLLRAPSAELKANSLTFFPPFQKESV